MAILLAGVLASGCGNHSDLVPFGAQSSEAGDDGNVPFDGSGEVPQGGADADDDDDGDEGDRGGLDVPVGDDDGGGNDCTYTQGYWKNHAESWPVTQLTIGGVAYPASELLALLRTRTGGDASLILGHQLIAARLNVSAGADPSSIAAALADADAWMTANRDADGRLSYGVHQGSARTEAIGLASALDDFNQGVVGPGHCD